MNKTKPTIILLDVLAILYRAYYAIPDLSTKDGKKTGALYGVASTVLKLHKEFNPQYIIATFDLADVTHRAEHYEDYKASRKPPEDDLIEQIEESHELLKAMSVPIYEKSGFEADDIIGTLAEKFKKDNNIVIATGDVDLLQLVEGDDVRVFMLKRGISNTQIYDEEAVQERFEFPPINIIDYKGLRGDPSDEIPGVAGIGDKGATQLIKEFTSIENVYKALEKGEDTLLDKGIPKRVITALKKGHKDAELSKTLATIVKDVPVNVLPLNSTWEEELDVSKAVNFFQKLEFNSLVSKIQNIKPATNEEQEKKEVDPALEKEASILLWITNTNITNANHDEILAHTNTTNLIDAKEILLQKIKKDEDLKGVWEEIEKPLIEVVEKMEQEGIKIDTVYFKELSKKFEKLVKELEQKIYKHAGAEFNINSPKQLSEILFDKLSLGLNKKTKTGARSTRESELTSIKDTHSIIPLILNYRHYTKLLSTYINVLPTKADSKGRIHTHLLQNGTATGRMSSREPNLQNIPKKTEEGRKIREGFIAEKGYVFVSFDYSQIELRLAAILSQDEILTASFQSGQDIHSEVAARLFQVGNNKVDADSRYKAKIINFGILYGMGVNALAATFGGKEHKREAQQFLDNYKKTFSTLMEYFEKVKKQSRDKGFVNTLFGRKRIIPGSTSSHPAVRSRAERIAINAPIQGTQADIIKCAMVRINSWIQKEKRDDVRMLLQIHDELIFEIKEEAVDEVTPTIKQLMEENILPEQTKVPIVVNVSVGSDWGKL